MDLGIGLALETAVAGVIDFSGESPIIRLGRPTDCGFVRLEETLPDLILASASPRRQQLFSLLGVPFSVAVSDVDETFPPDKPPEEIVRDLALSKAQMVAARQPRSLIIAADTVVDLDGRILGKPQDTSDAAVMLASLRGRWHRVWTGLAIMGAGLAAPLGMAVETDVFMRDYADAEIAAYVASGDPLDKAAAYAIQHAGFHPVARIEGCHANVMGLPLCALLGPLVQAGVVPPVLPAAACPVSLRITCPPAYRGQFRTAGSSSVPVALTDHCVQGGS